MRFLALILTVAALAADARADGADDAFQQWATGVARTRQRTICLWGNLQHPASKSPGRFVWFTDPARPHAQWIVFETGGKRWVVRHEERADWGGEELAPCAAAGLTRVQELTFNFGDQSNMGDIKETVTVLDGDIVQLSDDGEGYHDARRVSWVDGTYSWTDPHPLPDEPHEGPDDERRMLFALPEGSRWWAKLPALEPQVTFGRKRWTGKADADFSVRVVTIPGALRVELTAADDREVLPPGDADARAVVRADHFELWFCAERTSAPDCQQRLTQLAVARTRTGGALARWLTPSSAPTPDVTVNNNRLIVTLPRNAMGAEAGPLGFPVLVPLTIAYSDSDDAAAGQQTMIATAAIAKARPIWSSLLAVADGDRPFPRWHRAKPLAAGDDIFAEHPTCSPRAVARARADAAAPLTSGTPADAAARLTALADLMRDRCGGHLSNDTSTSLANDLALARHKAGDDAGCLVVLRNARDPVSPPVARATNFNRALCGGPCTEGSPGCGEGKAARGRGQGQD